MSHPPLKNMKDVIETILRAGDVKFRPLDVGVIAGVWIALADADPSIPLDEQEQCDKQYRMAINAVERWKRLMGLG